MRRPRLAAATSVALTIAALSAIAGGVAVGATPTTTSPPATAATTTTPPATTAPTTTPPATTVTTTAAPATTVVPTSSAPSTSSAPTTITPTTVPEPIAGTAIRDAKVGVSRFVADNFATPNAILDPCPLLTVDAANAAVAGLGLIPTDVPYGVSLYRDTVGVGIIGITCGADLSAAATPAGATLFAVEVTILDGQAVFPQYVERLGGRNTPIERAAPELGGEMFARCRTEPQVCVAGWHSDGFIVTVKLDGPRTADSETQVRQLLAPIAQQVVVNLASVPPGP